MKNTWVLSIRTSLPKVCENAGELKTHVFTFESFEDARTALRKALKKYAFSKNSQRMSWLSFSCARSDIPRISCCVSMKPFSINV